MMLAIHSLANPALTWLAWIIAICTCGGAFAWIISAIYWSQGNKVLAKTIAIAMLLGVVESEIFKHLVHRLRPSDVYPFLINLPLPDLGQAKFSFPSAHALLAMTFAFIVFYHFRSWKAATVFLIPIAVGVARVYQGLHWPSDIIGAYLLGVGTACVVLASSATRPAPNASDVSLIPTSVDA